MRTVALVTNPSKPRACEIVERLENLLNDAQIQTIRADTNQSLHLASDRLAQLKSAELVFVLGGDGTMLGVARQVAELQIPLLGINVGHLGFLTQSELTDVEETVRRVVNREYEVESRLMLQADVIRGGDTVTSFIGLNDAGVAKGSFGRMVTLDVFVDDVYLDTYRGDGVLVSTPTGSTAYSLSCGGPIVLPTLEVLLITPICPHTLFARPCVIDHHQVVRLVVQTTHDDIGLTVDGQVGVHLAPGDEVVIRKSNWPTYVVKWYDREFFSVLRTKLHDAGTPSPSLSMPS